MATLECPEIVPADAREEWQRIVGRLEASGVLAQVDRQSIVAYCVNWSRWLAAETWISENGTVVYLRNDKGELKGVLPAPQVNISKSAQGIMRTFLADCGLTPAAEVKVSRKPGRKSGSGSENADLDARRAAILDRLGAREQ